MTQRNCPECNCDTFRCQDYNKMVNEKFEIGSRFKKMYAAHGLEKAQWELEKIRLEEGMKYLQQKTLRQAKHLKKLEAKLIKLGKRPYEEEPKEITGM